MYSFRFRHQCQMMEAKLADGQVFMEFEQIPKKLAVADYKTAQLPENVARNRFRDVLPYDENRVKVTPTKDNKTGYINASHVVVRAASSLMFSVGLCPCF